MGRIVSLLLALLLAACGSGEAATPLPTLTLIPVTATFTPVPATATLTPTPPALLNPADLITPTADAEPVSIPPGARPMVELAVGDLSQRRQITPNTIELLHLEAATWSSVDLGCGDTSIPALTNLAISGYRMVLAVEGETYIYHTDTRSAVRLCQGDRPMVGRTDELLLERDPVAAELVALAQARLARELDLATRRARVVSVRAYTWTDSSLGCPRPGQTYVPVSVPGYRIILNAGEREYIFHSDSTQLIPCEAGSEVLPE